VKGSQNDSIASRSSGVAKRVAASSAFMKGSRCPG